MLRSKTLTPATLAVAVVASLAACVATPDLEYAADEGGATPDGSTSGSGSSSGTSSGSTSGASSSGSSGTSSGGTSGALDASAEADTGPGPAPEAGAPCPLVAAFGVQCCAAAPSANSRTCVQEACGHCGDCFAAGCTATQYCCPRANGGGKYKGVSCANTPTCP